jgi:hypothetical protein
VPRAITPDLRLDSRRLKDHRRGMGIEIGPALSPIRLPRTFDSVGFRAVIRGMAGVIKRLELEL